MAAMLETPSRIWRRIEAIEDRDMPSLPSLPSFDVSAEIEESTAQPIVDDEDDAFSDLDSLSSPVTSTPASHHTATLTGRLPSSTSSTARFANSIASRSNKSMSGLLSSRLSSRKSMHDSFEVPSLPRIQTKATEERDDDDDEQSKSSVPDVYLPPDEDQDGHPELDREYSLTDALKSISRSSSPSFPGPPISQGATPKKNYDYSMSLKSEPKVSVLNTACIVPTNRCRLGISFRQVSQYFNPTNKQSSDTDTISFPHIIVTNVFTSALYTTKYPVYKSRFIERGITSVCCRRTFTSISHKFTCLCWSSNSTSGRRIGQ